MITNPAKIEHASRLRDIAIAAIRQHGTWGPATVGDKTIKVMQLSTGSLDMILSTPFQKLPGLRRSEHGLDIYYAATKVLSLWWDDGGGLELVTFRPGRWESELGAVWPSLN
jgi:hypothetical protein